MNHYDHYFSQKGGALSDSHFGPIYQARHHLQRGRGFASIFTNLVRFLSPYLAKGARALGVEAARSGAEILGNLGTQPIGSLLKEQRDKSLKNLGTKAGAKLTEMQQQLMTGHGIKGRGDVNQFIASLDKLKERSKRWKGVKRVGQKRKAIETKNTKKRSTTTTTTKRRQKNTNKSSKSAFLKQYMN